MRSQRSASFMKWVEMKMVTPSLPGQIDHQLPEQVARDRIDAGSRFVENQQFRLMHHRHRQREPLAHAQRQAVGQAVQRIGRSRSGCHFIHPRLNVGSAPPETGGRASTRFCRTINSAIQREGLRHVADARRGGDVASDRCGCPNKAAVPSVAGEQAGQHLHGGGFAAAVGAEETENFAAARCEN